jgi:hypothetical protein
VPMVQPPTPTPSVRLRKGQKRTKKKEAVVTALYTISPHQRTPQEVVAALLQDTGRPEPAVRPRPVDKERQAPLAGKAMAISRLARRVAQRDGPHIHQHVALTDGAEALQQQMRIHFPEHTVILDIIHATEYLGDTANTLRGEIPPHGTAWVRAYLEALLAGQTDAVITALAAEGKDPTRTATQQQAVRRTVSYYRRNRPNMRYDEYLARGWPIGTGVVEGACGHLVKDRMEPRECAGPQAARRRCSTCGRCGATGIGRPMGRCIDTNNISGCMAAPFLHRRWQKPSAGVGCLMNRLSTNFGHTQILSPTPRWRLWPELSPHPAQMRAICGTPLRFHASARRGEPGRGPTPLLHVIAGSGGPMPTVEPRA